MHYNTPILKHISQLRPQINTKSQRFTYKNPKPTIRTDELKSNNHLSFKIRGKSTSNQS